MADPTLTQTFGTSVVEVWRSFSSTDTATSIASDDASALRPPQSAAAAPTTRLARPAFYSRWAPTYDRDDSMLRRMDEVCMAGLMAETARDAGEHTAVWALDVGCGTGGSTLALARGIRAAMVVGWDADAAMLAAARAKCAPAAATTTGSDRDPTPTRFELVDFADPRAVDPPHYLGRFHLVVSALLLEHCALGPFFQRLARLVRSGGCALVSNVHPDLRATSPLAFVDGQGTPVECETHVHGVVETVAAARHAGFELTRDPIVEQGVAQMLDGGRIGSYVFHKGMVRENERKWVGVNVWYAIVLKKI